MPHNNRHSSASPQGSLLGGSPPPLSPPSPLAGIRRLRETLSLKQTWTAYAEKERLKALNRHARPLTHRNMDVFLIAQDQQEARQSVQGIAHNHVSKWLRQIP